MTTFADIVPGNTYEFTIGGIAARKGFTMDDPSGSFVEVRSAKSSLPPLRIGKSHLVTIKEVKILPSARGSIVKARPAGGNVARVLVLGDKDLWYRADCLSAPYMRSSDLSGWDWSILHDAGK
jgi:hypothetical protein